MQIWYYFSLKCLVNLSGKPHGIEVTTNLVVWWHIYSHDSGAQRSDIDLSGLKSRCGQGCAPPRGSKEKSVSWSFPAPTGSGIPQLLACPACSQAATGHLSDPPPSFHPSDHSWERFCDCKDSCEVLGPTWTTSQLKTIILITSTKALYSVRSIN